MKHFLNGIEISPRNLIEIGVKCDFTSNPDILNISVDTLILPREAKDMVLSHVQTVGLFEGIPYLVDLGGGVTLEYYVDLTQGYKVRQNEVEVKIVRRNGRDSFFDRANGTSFELMRSKNVPFNLVDVPYFIIKDNQLETSISLSIATFIMTKEALEQAKAVATAIAELIEVSTPIVGLGPTGPVISYNVGGIIKASLVVILQVTYLAFLVIAIIDMAKDLFLMLFPPLRKLKGCSFYDLLDKSCAFLGYTFESDLLTNDPHWYICPVPLTKNRKSIFDFKPDQFNQAFNHGTPSSSDSVTTVGQFIDSLELMFNARLIVNEGKVRLERRDWLQNNTTIQIETALIIQDDRDTSFTYNSEDIWKRYYIHYTPDFTDLHCCDGVTYDNHDAEFSLETTFAVTNPDLITIKGLNEVAIPYSLGARKDKLNWLESSAKLFFVAIDAIVNLFGGNSNLASQIGNRKNCLQISQQFFASTKVLYGKLGEITSNSVVQKSNYFDGISATALWNNYHYINAIQENDYIIYENARARITRQDFYAILTNNFATINGISGCEILTLTWLDEKSYAEITYRVPDNWAQNKVSILTIN